MEVEVLLRACIRERLLYMVDLSLRLLVAERIRKGEEGRLARRVAEHVLESQDELILVVQEIVHLREDATPFLLGVGEHAEDGLQSLAVELGLNIQILEGESELLALRHSVDRKVEPSPVAVLEVGRGVVGDPEEVLTSVVAFAHP